jgi:CRISPR-associated protein Cas1
MPEGVLLDAPERCRDRYETGETFAFGATVIETDFDKAQRLLTEIAEGLVRLGKTKPRKPVALGGNFDLIHVEDLIAGTPLGPDEDFAPLGFSTITSDVERLLPRLNQPITLRFQSPLRLDRPGADIEAGHHFADGSSLNIGQLLRAVQKRLATIGMRRRGEEQDPPFDDRAITLVENRLNWLDLEYGPRDKRKSLGGALGRVVVSVHDPTALIALVWGQYARIGRNLHFGFGRYRIEELGADPTECRRSRSLLDLCLTPTAVTRAAGEHNLPLEKFRESAEQLRTANYQPGRPSRVVLHDPDGEPRTLLIPPVQDRALQRLILERLGPAVDRLFETSSFAWRKGLSREAAARRIERLVKEGWRYAVLADFDRFFDRVPRRLVRERLETWLGDDQAVQAIMGFVEGGSPGEVGLATGSPLSPLLGNLLLDGFDEEIEREGARLVRYADDFLVLARNREQADQLHSRSRELAGALLLQLNQDSTVIDLHESFDFLGFRFHQEVLWRFAGPTGPIRVEELGWKDADRTPSPLTLPFPHEVPDASASGVIVAGPGISHLDVVGDSLQIRSGEHSDDLEVPLASVERLILIGPAAWTSDAPGKLLKAGVPVLLVSEGGWPLGELIAETADNPDVLIAQCRASLDPSVALELARPLVDAKLRNFATLVEVLEGPDQPTSHRLREFAEQLSTADSLDSLRGIEGAAAAAWYRRLPSYLGRGFSFSRRVAPDADDPVNVLLNLGHTMMHRHAIAACRAAGLSPSVGFLHQGDGRHAALASDLQEPFRALVERAVIVATRTLKPSSFERRPDGPHPLVLDHHASKKFHALLQRSLRTAVIARGREEPRTWLAHLLANARSLRRRLLDASSPWEPFQHP